MTESRRVGVLGGTFDPIHIGHLAAVDDVADQLQLDRVLFIPNNRSPHKCSDAVSPVSDRVAMVEHALADNPAFELCRIELERDGLSFTLDTLRLLRSRLPSTDELFFLMGCDALPQLHLWHKPEALLTEFKVVVMDRPVGAALDWEEIEQHFPAIRDRIDVCHVVQLEISSSEIRQRVRTNRPIRYYVLPVVEQYIQQRGLYLTADE